MERIISLKERIKLDEIAELSKKMINSSVTLKILDSIPNIVLLLNGTRQIVFANKVIYEYIEKERNSSIIGYRVGELFHCIHSKESIDSCGNSESCKTCGALLATISAINKKEAVEECRIYNDKIEEAFDFRVHTSNIEIENENFVVFALNEINDEKRRKILERIFFHDISNTAAGFSNIAELLEMELPEEFDTYKKYLKQLSSRLINEISAQRQLLAAENNELHILNEKLNSISILQETIDIYLQYDISKNKEINLDTNSDSFEFISDKAIFGRIISNLLKNALEASRSDKLITLGCKQFDNYYQFWVNNPSFMSKEIQLQIFQRSFSTKGQGRGIGTYSVKLLAEKYLKGEVSFHSTHKEGTTFFIKLPVNGKK